MFNKLNLILILLTLFATSKISAQQITNSPYSRYGLGDIYTPGFGYNIAMGGSGIANSSPMYLNMLNPAGNTSLLMQRFVFDVGLDSKFTTTESIAGTQKNNNTTFKYLAGGFAAKPWMFFNFMLTPYSSVGYEFKDTTKLTDSFGTEHTYPQNITGSGGLNKVSLSVAFKFLKMVSVGVTGSYIFGSLDRSSTVSNVGTERIYNAGSSSTKYVTSYTSSEVYKSRYIITGFNYNLGFMFSKSFRSKKDTLRNALKINIGATLATESKINARDELFLYKYNTLTATTDTIANDTIAKGKITLPNNLGLGIALELKEMFTICADYKMQDWSNFSIAGEDNTPLGKNTTLSAGLQFVQDKYSSRYYKTINYRFGLYTEDTYLTINGQTIKDQGISFGLGLPIKTLVLNIGCNFGKRGTTEHNLYQEKYFLLHFNVTAHDVWFVKRKFQ